MSLPPLYLAQRTPAVEKHWQSVLEKQWRSWKPFAEADSPGIVIYELHEGDDLTPVEAADFKSLRDAGHQIIATTLVPAPRQGLEAIRAGAQGYIHALANPDRISEAIETVAHGNAWLSHTVVQALTQQLLNKPIPSERWKEKLSKREAQVAEAVLEGLSNHEIADKLHISETTVKTHLKNIYNKFDVSDRLALVLKIQGESRSTQKDR